MVRIFFKVDGMNAGEILMTTVLVILVGLGILALIGLFLL